MTVRIVRAESREVAPRARLFEPTARAVDAAQWEARLEAERTLAAARSEAEALVAHARSEADGIRARALQEGRDRAHAETAAVLIRANAEGRKTAERATALIITATKAVAERAFTRALAQDDATLAAWAREALVTISDARRIVVRAAPAAAARLRAADLGRAVDVVDDASLEPNVLLARSELGELTVDVRTQIDAFVAAIGDVLASEVARV